MRRLLCAALSLVLLLQPAQTVLADPEWASRNSFLRHLWGFLRELVLVVADAFEFLRGASSSLVPILWSLWIVTKVITWGLGVKGLIEVSKIAFWLALFVTVVSFTFGWLASKLAPIHA